MMYPYMVLQDQTEIIHSQILKDEGGKKYVLVHFERPKDGGFDSARCQLPGYFWVLREGFTEAEIASFEGMLQHHAHLIFKFAERGGISCT